MRMIWQTCDYLMESIDAEEMKKISPDYFANVGTGKDLEIKELVDIVRNVISYKGEIRWGTSKPDGTLRKLLDISKITQLGWRLRIKIEEGIKLAYESYLRRKAK